MIRKRVFQKIYRRTARIPISTLNYYLGNYKENIIWVIGDGRSGTTWLSTLINWQENYREIFEPIHPLFVQEAKEIGYFPYVDPNEENKIVYGFMSSVFSGRFKNFRADVGKVRLLHRGLLVKDIYGNLLAPWVNQNFPAVKKILIIRNPFAVALSKQTKKNWDWCVEPAKLLERPSLYKDHLSKFEDVILKHGNTFLEKQILLWSILHYIPLLYLNGEDIYILFFEDLVDSPVQELEKISRFLSGNLKDFHKENNEVDPRLLTKINKPSRTVGKNGAMATGENPINLWKNRYSKQEIDSCIKILDCFGLAELYGQEERPDSNYSLFSTKKSLIKSPSIEAP